MVLNRRKVWMVEDIEKIRAELQLPPFRERQILRDLHVPILRTWQAQGIFANIAERPEDNRIIDIVYLRRFEGN